MLATNEYVVVRYENHYPLESMLNLVSHLQTPSLIALKIDFLAFIRTNHLSFILMLANNSKLLFSKFNSFQNY